MAKKITYKLIDGTDIAAFGASWAMYDGDIVAQVRGNQIDALIWIPENEFKKISKLITNREMETLE